jgi:hypothetical protein
LGPNISPIPPPKKCVFCSHNRKCKVCFSVKDQLNLSSLNKLDIARQVKASGKFNFEGCRIPVNHKIDTAFMTRMLHDYNDLQVCELLKFGFPIDVKTKKGNFK